MPWCVPSHTTVEFLGMSECEKRLGGGEVEGAGGTVMCRGKALLGHAPTPGDTHQGWVDDIAEKRQPLRLFKTVCAPYGHHDEEGQQQRPQKHQTNR